MFCVFYVDFLLCSTPGITISLTVETIYPFSLKMEHLTNKVHLTVMHKIYCYWLLFHIIVLQLKW